MGQTKKEKPKKKQILLKLNADLVNMIDSQTENRTQWIIDAIEAKLDIYSQSDQETPKYILSPDVSLSGTKSSNKPHENQLYHQTESQQNKDNITTENHGVSRPNGKTIPNDSSELSSDIYSQNNNDSGTLEPPTRERARAVSNNLFCSTLEKRNIKNISFSSSTTPEGGRKTALEGAKESQEQRSGLSELKNGQFGLYLEYALPEGSPDRGRLAQDLLKRHSAEKINIACQIFLEENNRKFIQKPIEYLRKLLNKITSDQVYAWKRELDRRRNLNNPIGWQPDEPENLLSPEENSQRAKQLLSHLSEIKCKWDVFPHKQKKGRWER